MLATRWPSCSPGERRRAAVDAAELAAAFEAIEGTRGTKAKEALAADLLGGLGPLSAKYVAKILTGDLRIGLKEGLVEEAVAEAFEHPTAAIRAGAPAERRPGAGGGRGKHGRLDEVRMALFQPLKSMLATAEATPEAIATRLGHELWVEDKLDGVRAQAHKQGDRVELYSRDLKPVTAQFPEVRDALLRITRRVCAGWRGAGRAGRRAAAVLRAAEAPRSQSADAGVLAEVPVIYVIFDCLSRDGEALLDAPLRVRRAALEALPPVEGWSFRCSARPRARRRWSGSSRPRGHGERRADGQGPGQPVHAGPAGHQLAEIQEGDGAAGRGGHRGRVRPRPPAGVLSDYTFAVRDEASGELLNMGKAFTGLTDAEIVRVHGAFQGDDAAELRPLPPGEAGGGAGGRLRGDPEEPAP